MSVKNSIVTCRFLPKEKERLNNVAENTGISVSSIARIAISEFLSIFSVDKNGKNQAEYREGIISQYKKYMMDEWLEPPQEMVDHQQKFLDKLYLMKGNLDRQIAKIENEKLNDHDRLAEQVERDMF